MATMLINSVALSCLGLQVDPDTGAVTHMGTIEYAASTYRQSDTMLENVEESPTGTSPCETNELVVRVHESTLGGNCRTGATFIEQTLSYDPAATGSHTTCDGDELPVGIEFSEDGDEWSLICGTVLGLE